MGIISVVVYTTINIMLLGVAMYIYHNKYIKQKSIRVIDRFDTRDKNTNVTAHVVRSKDSGAALVEFPTNEEMENKQQPEMAVHTDRYFN